MTASPARSRMTMRVDVLRNAVAADAVDGYGNPLPPDFRPYQTGLPCFAWNTASREVIDGEKTAVVEDLRAMIPVGADVTEADRLESVKDRLGGVLFPGPFLIEAPPVRKSSHLELVLRRVA